jgi:Mg-chelatase subunit ChlD
MKTQATIPTIPLGVVAFIASIMSGFLSAEDSPKNKLAQPPLVISTEKYQQTTGSSQNKKYPPQTSQFNHRQAARFYGVNAPGETFVFVIDNSTSMLDGDRRAVSHSALLRTVSSLKFPQRFHVIAFDAETMHVPWGPYISAQSADSRKLAGWLARLTSVDGTMPGPALKQAVGMNPDAVFFLTDGQFDSPTTDQIHAWNRFRVPIHVIDLSPGESVTSLKKIASDSGGHYRKSP